MKTSKKEKKGKKIEKKEKNREMFFFFFFMCEYDFFSFVIPSVIEFSGRIIFFPLRFKHGKIKSVTG